MHLRVNDEVVVVAGNSKGQRGRVLQLLKDDGRVLIEGVNVHLQNLRKTQANPQGGEVEREFPVHISSVLLWSEKAGKGVRTKMKQVGDKKVRVGIPCGTQFELKS
jgi:large subunit ribosomal protein L24